MKLSNIPYLNDTIKNAYCVNLYTQKFFEKFCKYNIEGWKVLFHIIEDMTKSIEKISFKRIEQHTKRFGMLDCYTLCSNPKLNAKRTYLEFDDTL